MPDLPFVSNPKVNLIDSNILLDYGIQGSKQFIVMHKMGSNFASFFLNKDQHFSRISLV